LPVLTVAILYVVAAGINSTGALDYVLNKVLGQPSTLSLAQLRLILPVAFVSAFLNNTPVVAIMIPIVQRWATRINQPVSQLFIPLSFASILGGTCTLIGTSTNLVVAGQYEARFNDTIPLFDLGSVGVPVLFCGVVYIVLFAPLLLPGFEELRKRASERSGIDGEAVAREIGTDFTVSCVVLGSSNVCGRVVGDSGLRGEDGLYLTSVEREDRLFNAVGSEFVIQEGDILFFTGMVDRFDDFCAQRQLRIVTHGDNDQEEISSYKGWESQSHSTHFEDRLVKVMIRTDSVVAGKTPQEIDFRKRYDAAIVSLNRVGETVAMRGNLGQIVLQVGDVLLLVTGDRFDLEEPTTHADLKPLISDNAALQEALERKNSTGGRLDLGSDMVVEREFLIPMRVTETPLLKGARSLVGQTVSGAKLRGLPGLFLVAIEHTDGQVEHAVGPDAILQKMDMLWFIGERDAVSTLRRIPGLEAPDNQVQKLRVNHVQRRLVECVLSLKSNMVGKTIREIRFRTRYEAAIIAVHRQGHRVISRIGDIELGPGDVLILDTGPTFVLKHRDDPNFLLVTEIEDSAPPRFEKFYIAVVAIIAMMVFYLAFSDYISLFEPAVFAAAIMIATGCITPQRARLAVSWDVIVTISCAFGISTALENTGVANAIGEGLVSLAEITGTGFIGILSAVYLATFLISIVVANNAAAVLMFPIAVTAVEGQICSDSSFCLTQMMYILMLAASSSFSTPFGYQTNIMVLNCGNYVFKDFIKFGFPMQFWQMIFSVIIVYYMEFWYWIWLISFAVFVLVITLKVAPTFFKCNLKSSRKLKSESSPDPEKSRNLDIDSVANEIEMI